VKPTARLPAFAVVALLAAGGYLFVTRSRPAETPAGTVAPPFRSVPAPTPVSPRPPGLVMGRQMAVVDLNSASLGELETLPAITPEYARKIIAGRPFTSMSDVERAGIPHQVVEQMSPPAVIRVSGRGTPPGSLPPPGRQQP